MPWAQKQWLNDFINIHGVVNINDQQKQEDKAPNSAPLEIPRDALVQAVTKAVQDITIRLNSEPLIN